MGNIKVGISGLGRIGRYLFKLLFNYNNIDIVAINDISDIETIIYLLKFDSIYGQFFHNIKIDGNYIIINKKKIRFFNCYKPSEINWKKYNVDIVIDSTGKFKDSTEIYDHIKSGAKKVIISAPTSIDNIKTIVWGVNEKKIKNDIVISNASCTTNCIAPQLKVLNDYFSIENCFMTTIHCYTPDQNITDSPHKDLRRARAANLSIIPTTTGAIDAVIKVIPKLKNKIKGKAIRVPTPAVSFSELIVKTKKQTSCSEINNLFIEKSKNEYKGIIDVEFEKKTSRDFISSPFSCVIDKNMTKQIGNENVYTISSWYDNEAGYSNRLIDIIKYLATP